MEHTLILRHGDIVYVTVKGKSTDQHETDGRYAVVVSGHHQSKQRYVDVMYIDSSRQCYKKAYPVIWHQGCEAAVQGNTERIDIRRVLYIDGRCTHKEIARIDAVIDRRFANILQNI